MSTELIAWHLFNIVVSAVVAAVLSCLILRKRAGTMGCVGLFLLLFPLVLFLYYFATIWIGLSRFD